MPRPIKGVLAVGYAGVVLAVVILLMIDYQRLVYLRGQTDVLTTGLSETEIVSCLGQPDATWSGSRTDSTGETAAGYTIWIYCTRFDWDGVRSKWTDSPFLPYWCSRLNPSVHDYHDAAVWLWVRNGRLEVIENPVDENLIGRHPMISL